jgi:hypothetical protein
VRDRQNPEFLLFFLFTFGTAAYLSTWLSMWAESPIPLSLLFRANIPLTFALPGIFLFFFLDPAVKSSISVGSWLRKADTALYAAKGAGRDRVAVAAGMPGESSASGVIPTSDMPRWRPGARGLK